MLSQVKARDTNMLIYLELFLWSWNCLFWRNEMYWNLSTRSIAETFSSWTILKCLYFFLNSHEKYVAAKVLEYIQPFSLGIHRNVAGQMVASYPGSLITKCTNQTSLQIMVYVLCFIGIIVCVLLVFFFHNILGAPNTILKPGFWQNLL